MSSWSTGKEVGEQKKMKTLREASGQGRLLRRRGGGFVATTRDTFIQNNYKQQTLRASITGICWVPPSKGVNKERIYLKLVEFKSRWSRIFSGHWMISVFEHLCGTGVICVPHLRITRTSSLFVLLLGSGRCHVTCTPAHTSVLHFSMNTCPSMLRLRG